MRDAASNIILRVSLSEARLTKYLAASGSDLHKALALYERNTRLSESFYSPLQVMEVCLRNKVSEQLTASYGEEWFRPGKAPFENDAVEGIRSVVLDLNASSRAVTPGDIVAQLSFGFWVGLLGPRYDATIWRHSTFKAFLQHSRRMQRRTVHSRFNALRRFRNRIAHHEPIFLNNLPNVHAEIIEAVSWMCPTTAAWATSISRFSEVHAAL